MHWIIDCKDRFVEEEYQRLIELVDRAGIPYTLVSIDSNTNTLIEDVNIDDQAVVIGTVPLTKIAQEKGWVVFKNENFEFEQWKEHYGTHLLNYDSIICEFGEVPFQNYKDFFIRPVKDGKLFTGRAITSEEFPEWRNKLLKRPNDFGFGKLGLNTLVTVSSKKTLLREYRFFVIDGKVITGSLYRQGLYIKRELCVDPEVINFAKQMVELWQPDRAFVLDIGMTSDGFKVIEINCFNTSGFYCCDVYKIISAIEEMYN